MESVPETTPAVVAAQDRALAVSDEAADVVSARDARVNRVTISERRRHKVPTRVPTP